MLQSILVTVIVLIAFFAVLIPLFSKKKADPSCNTCASGGCGGCALSEVSKSQKTAAEEEKNK